MYALRSWLEIKGQVVYVNTKLDTDFVAVYPEIYNGNPAGANTVVRYILNKPGVMSLYGQPSPTQFEDTDHKFVFSKIFDTFNSDEDHLMFLPVLNLHEFKVTNKGNRPLACYFVGKGTNTNQHPAHAINITRDFANNQQALASVLNRCEVMYGYDPVSAMYEIARLCGCRVVIIPSTYTKEQFQDYEPGMNGISWGTEEEIPLEVDAFREHYMNMIKKFDKKIDRFIELTQ